MVSMCLPSDALLQHLPSYLGFSYLGRGVSLHSCSSNAQPLLLTLNEGYLLIAAPPDLECGIAPLGPPVPVHSHRSLDVGLLLPAAAPGLRRGVTPPVRRPWPRARDSSSLLLLSCCSLALLAAASDLGLGVAPLGRRPLGMGSSRLLPLTSDMR